MSSFSKYKFRLRLYSVAFSVIFLRNSSAVMLIFIFCLKHDCHDYQFSRYKRLLTKEKHKQFHPM